MNSLCGLILAAGLSSRMGESKPLLEWFGQTLIEYQINLFNSLNIKPLVVLGFQSETVISKIKNLNYDFILKGGDLVDSSSFDLSLYSYLLSQKLRL